MWFPDRSALAAPLYKSIASRLDDDIRDGALAPGERLPTHRELAEHLRVTVGTVTRAYADAAERGLVEATVGRGTFVRRRGRRPPELVENAPPGVVNLAMNRPVLGPHADALAETLGDIAASGTLRAFIDYVSPAGLREHREAGAEFLARLGHSATPDRVLVTCGAQSALGVLMSALTEPGDRVLLEELTYGGILAAAHQSHVEVHAVAMDEDGIRPDALEAACRAHQPRLLACVPNHHNPTALVMSEGRRRAIAAVARAHELIVIEDDVYGFLVEDRPPPLAAFYPEGTCTITCTSKSLIPGLRIGYVVAPALVVERIASAIRSTVWMAPPLMAEVATRWIRDGTADSLMSYQRSETRARQTIARETLSSFRPCGHPTAFHLWLPLPARWTAGSFTGALRERGVTVAASEAFVVGDAPVPRAVRLSVTAPTTRDELQHGLGIVAALLESGPEAGIGTI